MSLWEFRGLTADVGAGLVPAPCGATTRVARTPRNPKELIFFLLTEPFGKLPYMSPVKNELEGMVGTGCPSSYEFPRVPMS